MFKSSRYDTDNITVIPTRSDSEDEHLVIAENPSTIDPVSDDNPEVRTPKVTFGPNTVYDYVSTPPDPSIQPKGTSIKRKQKHFQYLRKRYRSPSSSDNSDGNTSDTSDDNEVAKYHKRLKAGKQNQDSTCTDEDSANTSRYPKYFDQAAAGMNPPPDEISSISVTPDAPPTGSNFVPDRYKQQKTTSDRTPSPSQDIRTRMDSNGNVKPLAGVSSSSTPIGMGRGQYFNRGVSGSSNYNVGSPRVSRAPFRNSSRDRVGRAPSYDRNHRTSRAPSADRTQRTGRAPSTDRTNRDRTSRVPSSDRGQRGDYRATYNSNRYDRSLPTSEYKIKLRNRADQNPVYKRSTNVKQHHNA